MAPWLDDPGKFAGIAPDIVFHLGVELGMLHRRSRDIRGAFRSVVSPQIREWCREMLREHGRSWSERDIPVPGGTITGDKFGVVLDVFAAQEASCPATS